MRGIFTADWHLSSGAWKDLDVNDSTHLSYLVDYAIEHELAIAAGGDLLDAQIQEDSIALSILHRQLDRLAAANVPVYFTEGQHERMRHLPWLSTHTWPVHVHHKTFQFCGEPVIGLNYTPRSELPSVFETLPKNVRVLLCHQVWKERVNFEGRWDASVLSTPSHIRYVLSGDFHSAMETTHRREDGSKVTLVSPGSLFAQSIDEPVQKSFYVVEGGDEWTFTPQPIPSRDMVRMQIRNESELFAFLAAAATGPKETPDLPPIIEVKLASNLASRADEIRRSAAGHFMIKLEKPPATIRADVRIDPQRNHQSQGYTPYLRHIAMPGSTRYRMLVRLLNALDPKFELAAMRKEFCDETS